MGGAPLYVCAWCYYLRVWLWLLFILGLLRALKNVIYQLSDSTKPPVQTSKVWLELSGSQWERKQPVRPLSEFGSKNQTEATTLHSAVSKKKERVRDRRRVQSRERGRKQKSSTADGNESCIKRSAGLRGWDIRLPTAPSGFKMQL